MTEPVCKDHHPACECRETMFAKMERALTNIQARSKTTLMNDMVAFMDFVRDETAEALKWNGGKL